MSSFHLLLILPFKTDCSFPCFLPNSAIPQLLLFLFLPLLILYIPRNIPQIYATAAGGFFLVFILVNFLSQTIREKIALFTFKHLTYPYFIHRHRLLGPCTWTGILVQLIYIALNVFCLDFRVPTLPKAGLRAGNLSLTNMIPLLIGPHLSFVADILGFRLGIYRRVHRSACVMSFALLPFHVLIVAFQQTSRSLRIPEHLYRTIVCPRRCLAI